MAKTTGGALGLAASLVNTKGGGLFAIIAGMAFSVHPALLIPACLNLIRMENKKYSRNPVPTVNAMVKGGANLVEQLSNLSPTLGKRL